MDKVSPESSSVENKLKGPRVLQAPEGAAGLLEGRQVSPLQGRTTVSRSQEPGPHAGRRC